MLNERNRSSGSASAAGRVTGPHRQRGVVLMIALIMLVAMTLAGLALMRSVDTTSLIAGNLAFQQAATGYSELGNNQALAWLQSNSAGTKLYKDDTSFGYSASISDPANNQSWDNFWINTLVPQNRTRTIALGVTDTDTGNVVSYAIQRMCTLADFSPTSQTPRNYCAVSTISVPNIRNLSGQLTYSRTQQTYYRITVRVAGPRNTASYTQTIVAI